jgi:hypothetical protein
MWMSGGDRRDDGKAARQQRASHAHLPNGGS